MVSFIVLFLPALLAVWIFEGLTRMNLSAKNWGSFYGVCVLMVNTIMMIIMRFLLNWAGESLNDMNIYMATNCLILALPIAVVFGLLAAMLQKNVKIELEEKNSAV